MSRFAVFALYAIGVFSILGGFIIGAETYETPIEGYTYLTEKNYTVLFTWIFAGLISGVMMFGFAEIVRLLSRQVEIQEGAILEEKKKNSEYILKS